MVAQLHGRPEWGRSLDGIRYPLSRHSPALIKWAWPRPPRRAVPAVLVACGHGPESPPHGNEPRCHVAGAGRHHDDHLHEVAARRDCAPPPAATTAGFFGPVSWRSKSARTAHDLSPGGRPGGALPACWRLSRLTWVAPQGYSDPGSAASGRKPPMTWRPGEAIRWGKPRERRNPVAGSARTRSRQA